jgi:protein-S-isoprenylcysteine O-methyltransferase Ste14
MPTQPANNTIELRHFFVTPGVAAAHALSGVAIFAGAESVLKTTPLYLLGLIVQNPIYVAFILIITAVLAITPYFMRKPPRSWFMLLILPQQCLLLMHFVSAGVAIMAGHYHDGYVPNGGSAFIFADQIWLLMVVVVHTLEYIEAL